VKRERAAPPRDPQALLAFALRHVVVTGFLGSKQHTDRNAYALAERTLRDYNLIYVWRGAAAWTVGGVEHRLREGDLIVAPPGVPHAGRSDARVMTFGSAHALAELPGGQDVFELFAVPRVRRVAPGSHLDRVFQLAMEEYGRGFADAAAMIPHWTALLVKELLRHDAAAGLLDARGADPVVMGILRFLEHELAARHNLGDLARRAGYTPQHLNRLFLRALGMTPLACLAGMRLERAATLLREGRLSVQAVAEAVGWPDPAYFSRVFRGHYGRSPSDFQRSAPGEAGPAT
jgi:AraC-like DNA-binding protein